MARLYDTALNRLPDVEGLTSRSTQLDAGASLRDVAARFIVSPKFLTRYGGLASADSVQAMYQNVFDRPGDPGGVNQWMGVPNGGQTDRAGVVAASGGSREHQLALAPSIGDGIVSA